MMRTEQKFSLDVPPVKVWAVLTDPFQVAVCLPGAEVIEQRDDGSYLGRLTVKVGPLQVVYRGEIRFERLDEDRLEAELVGRGQDVKGKGGAEMRMVSRLVPLEDGGTEVAVSSAIIVRGTLAQFGRGMIESVSAHLFEEFVAALRRKLVKGSEGTAGDAEGAKPLSAASVASSVIGQKLGRVLGRLTGRSADKR
jgi:carbon monoxide dehydrogenase subunit G